MSRPSNLRAPGRASAARSRQSLGPWRGQFLSVGLLLALVGCAEGGVIGVDKGDGGGGGIEDPILTGGTSSTGNGQCSTGETNCGDGCCSAGMACSDALTCYPDIACTEDDNCGSGKCGAAGRCVQWTGEPSPECRNDVQLAGVVPTVQCQWPGPSTPSALPESVQVMGTPMVVDFNLDGDPNTSHPSIVFISHSGAFSSREDTALRVIDGQDCSLLFTVPGGLGETTSDPYFITEVAPALGDLNRDGVADIIVAHQGANGPQSVRDGLAAYSLAGGVVNELWSTTQPNTGDVSGIALHDLDNDDVPEILTSKNVYNADGDPLFTLPTGAKEAPLVMNILGDPDVELITNQGVFNWDAANRTTIDVRIFENNVDSPLWTEAEKQPDMFVAVADLVTLSTQLSGGGADSVEMVMVSVDGGIIVTKADGVSIHRVTGGDRQAGGPAVIADFDGDGRMEFASAGTARLTVYDLDCKPSLYDAESCAVDANSDAVLWSVPVRSNQTSASVFDFDGDGRAEVVYADQCFMRIYDGTNGTVLFSVARSSLTKFEYPIVADVDGDSFSELVTGSNDANQVVVDTCPSTDPQFPAARYEPTHGITVWADPLDLWAGSRPIWNQHTYNVNNVLDDGTIPSASELKNSWNPVVQGGPNTFRQNIQGVTGATVDKPDLTVAGFAEFICYYEQQLVSVKVEMCNRGLKALAPGEATATLSRVPEQGTPVILAEAVEDDALAPGECANILVNLPYETGASGFNVMLSGDVRNQVDECAEQNNQGMIANVYCPGGPL